MLGEGGKHGVSLFTLAHNHIQVTHNRPVFYLFVVVSSCGLTL